MSPDPAGFDPEDILWFSYDWCSLPWTPWVPFSADRSGFHEIPHEPGLFRIRPVGKDVLMYIGETGRPLHKRLRELRQSLKRSDLMPWSDPFAEAPALWAYHDAETCEYECSAAALDASAAGRKGMERFLLYRYRQERGESPLCNFGRFHPRYRRSTGRKENKRGGRLTEDQQDNPAGWPGIAPLEAGGRPGDPGWMGLEWTAPSPLAAGPIGDSAPGAGLYLLIEAASGEILYIGQSAEVKKRLSDHLQNDPGERLLQFSYQIIGQSVLPHHLRELETDLVGNFFEQYRKAPAFQFRHTQ